MRRVTTLCSLEGKATGAYIQESQVWVLTEVLNFFIIFLFLKMMFYSKYSIVLATTVTMAGVFQKSKSTMVAIKET